MTTQNTTLPNSWEDRIDQFAKIIGLSIEEVEAAFAEKPFELTKETPYVLEMLSDDEVTPFGDIRKMFCDDRNISLPKLRLGIKYLRGPKEVRETGTGEVDPDLMELQTKYGIKTRFEDLGAEELLPHYNPQKQNRIFKALKNIFGNKPVIAFDPDTNRVAVEETVNYIVDLNDGYPEVNAIEVKGELVTLHPIGVMPDRTVEEDPLFKGQPLKRGRSIVNRINWSGIGKEERQFARLLVEEGEFNPNNRMEVRQVLTDVQGGIDELKDVYPEVYMKFKQLKKRDELPKLIMALEDVNTRVNNPFGITNRTY